MLIQKERRKKRAEKIKREKQKAREAKKRRIKRQLAWKARKKDAIATLAKIGNCDSMTLFGQTFLPVSLAINITLSGPLLHGL